MIKIVQTPAGPRRYHVDRTGYHTQQCTSNETPFCIGKRDCIFCDRIIVDVQ